MEGIQSVRLGTVLGLNSAAAARGAAEAAATEEGSSARGAAEQDAVSSEEGVGGLTDDLTRYFLNYLNPTELAKMSEVAKGFKLTINNDHHLNNRMQHGKYLRLAKQTADQIEDVFWKSEAYCAIATEQAKTNPEDANQTLILA